MNSHDNRHYTQKIVKYNENLTSHEIIAMIPIPVQTKDVLHSYAWSLYEFRY